MSSCPQQSAGHHRTRCSVSLHCVSPVWSLNPCRCIGVWMCPSPLQSCWQNRCCLRNGVVFGVTVALMSQITCLCGFPFFLKEICFFSSKAKILSKSSWKGKLKKKTGTDKSIFLLKEKWCWEGREACGRRRTAVEELCCRCLCLLRAQGSASLYFHTLGKDKCSVWISILLVLF